MENKTGKYLQYAIGEIILVVIGILIALSINNWNENRKNDIKLYSSMHLMIGELEETIKSLNDRKQRFQFKADKLETIINNEYKEQELENITNYFGQEIKFKSFKKEFVFLKEEKLLQRINDSILLNKINKYYEQILYDLEDRSKWHKSFVVNNIDPFILEVIPSHNNTVNSEFVRNLLNNTKFKNILNYQKIIYQDFVSGSSFNVKCAEELIEHIELYLKEK